MCRVVFCVEVYSAVTVFFITALRVNCFVATSAKVDLISKVMFCTL